MITLLTAKVLAGKGLGLIGKIPREVWIGLLVGALVYGYGYHKYHVGFDAATAVYTKAHAAQVEAEEKRIKALEEAHEKDRIKIADIYIERMGEGYEKRDAIIAELQSNPSRLRPHWQGCPSGSGTPATSAELDENTRLRAIDTGNLIKAGSDCDATISALQGYVNSYLKASGVE